MPSNLAIVLAGAALFGAGYLLAPGGAAEPAQPPPTAALARADAAPARGLTEADVRRVLRQELAPNSTQSASAEATSNDSPPSDEGEPAALSPAATAALHAARDRIDRAHTTSRWNPDDAAALATTLELLPPAQRDELLSALVPALNRGEIQLTYSGPIFQ